LPRILFLSASVGVGHSAAAAAVRGALAELVPNVETQTVDSYKYAAKIFSKVVADGYIGMVKTVPQLYRYIYERAERARDIPAFRRWVSQYTASNLRTLVTERKPDLVVCTHAFPCGVMAEYKRKFDPDLPVVGVVTDFAVHPFWIYPNIDAYAVATPEIRQVLLARGVASEKIVVSGIPVDPRFGRPRLPRDELRAALGLPRDRNIVLMMGGGLGIGPLDRMIRALGRLDLPVAGAIIVGRNVGLERRILALAEQTEYPLRVFGFVDNVYDFMHASEVLLTKAGGLTSSEALSAELPMILMKPLPGQEERNTRYLVSRRAALRARNERQVAQAVREVLTSAERRAQMAASIAALRRPDAARAVAERIVALLSGRPLNPRQAPDQGGADEVLRQRDDDRSAWAESRR
jgi:processive 1,2-diacylglycerol beta-glucosyltransferase